MLKNKTKNAGKKHKKERGEVENIKFGSAGIKSFQVRISSQKIVVEGVF